MVCRRETSSDRSGISTRNRLQTIIASSVATTTRNARCVRTKCDQDCLALLDEALPSPINQTGIVQCFPDLHQPVAVPAVQLVAPCLSGRVKAHLACTWMMWAKLLLVTRDSDTVLYVICCFLPDHTSLPLAMGSIWQLMTLITLITLMSIVDNAGVTLVCGRATYGFSCSCCSGERIICLL